MKRLFLVYGLPGAGKSTLADYLQTECSFRRLSLDDPYVEFVKQAFPELYFPALNQFIMHHYEMIRRCDWYVKDRLGRDLVVEWHCHLLSLVRELLNANENDLVVEGYLLVDSKDTLAAELQNRATVFEVGVENHTYTWHGRSITVEEVAILGLDTA